MKKEKHVIYQILNLITGKTYVGSTVDIKRRKRTHVRLLRKGNHHSNKLQNSFNKYGEDSFDFIILEEVSDVNLLIEREQFWLDKIKPEYNMTLVAGLNSHLGLKRSDETKKKISDALKGRKLSQEHIEAMRKGLTGLKQTEEAKKIRFEARKNSELVKKAYQSDERKEKIKETRIKNGGYVVTEEMKLRISETLKSKNLQSAVSIKIGKYTIDGVLLEIYPSMLKAEKENNFGVGTLYYNIVKKKKEIYKNFKWKIL